MARRPDKAIETEAPLGGVPVTADGRPLNISDFQVDGTLPPVSISRVGWVAATQFIDLLPLGWEAICGDFAVFLAAQRLAGDADTDALASAIASYRHRRLLEIEGVDESEVREALRTIERAVNRLLSVTRPGGPGANKYDAAWSRIARARAPYEVGNREPEEEIYPALTLIRARLPAAKLDRQEIATSSMTVLVDRLATLVENVGGRATASGGIVRKDGPELSAFVTLVKAALERAAMPPPCSMTDRGLSQAVATALKARAQ